MKKSICVKNIFAVFLMAFFAEFGFCEEADYAENKALKTKETSLSENEEPEKNLDEEEFSFADLDMVELGPKDGEMYDIYVIGDGSQSFTEKRWTMPA